MATLPEYRYGEVEGLPFDLRVVSERGETPMVCCGYCSAQMAALTARAGLSSDMRIEAHRMRRLGGRPHDAGNTASELRDGARRAVEVQLIDVPKVDILDRLRGGFAVTVGLQYGDLPRWLRVQTNDFGHAACLYGLRDEGLVGYFDPLWSQGARGAWVPWPALAPSLWGNGNHSTTTERQATMAGDYVIYNEQVTSLKTGYIDGGTPFFNDWQLKDQRGKIASDGKRFEIMGHRDDAYAVQVTTSQGWATPDSRPTLVFVAKSKVSDIKDAAPPTTTPPPSTDCSAALAERDAAWEQALIHGEPWPSA